MLFYLVKDPSFKDLWVSLPAEAKSNIKNFALATLASPKKDARKGAAQAVSAIATIELPLQQWNDIINVLAVNAQGTTLEFKMSSLDTLGYICEEIPEKSLNDIQVNAILSALVTNITPEITNDEVKQTALIALCSSLRFCEKNFKIEYEKSLIIANILGNCASPKYDIRMKAMQCLLEVVRCYYDYIGGTILQQLASTTFQNIRLDTNEDVSLLAIEVWCSICDEEISRLKANDPILPCMNYIKAAYASLMEILLECLKRKPNDSEGDWTISLAGACCLALVANIIKDPITEPVCNYIGENIGSPDWKNREAALLAFASILKGPQKERMNSIAQGAIQTLVALLRDQKQQVRETTAWTFVKLAEHNYEPLIEQNVLPIVIRALVSSLTDKPKVSTQVCFALNAIAESIAKSCKGNESFLSPYINEILSGLWTNAFRLDGCSENSNLANASFAAFSIIVQVSSPDINPILGPILEMLVTEFHKTLSPDYKVPGSLHEFQEYLCSSMQPILIKISTKISESISKSIVDNILESFKRRQTVYEEGILALSGLATAIGKDFDRYMEQFGPYLVFALKKLNDASLCRVATGCVADLARGLEDLMSQYLSQVMPVFMDILRNPDTDRCIKITIISTLSDIAMSTNRFFMPYLKDVMEMLKSASSLSINQSPTVIFYFNKHRMTLISLVTCNL